MRQIGIMKSITIDDFVNLITDAKRLNREMHFLQYLELAEYRYEGSNVYSSRNPPDKIQISFSTEGVSYINLKNENDKGSYIQFLQNRLFEESKITVNDDFPTFIKAIMAAQTIERILNMRTENRKKIPLKVKRKKL